MCDRSLCWHCEEPLDADNDKAVCRECGEEGCELCFDHPREELCNDCWYRASWTECLDCKVPVFLNEGEEWSDHGPLCYGCLAQRLSRALDNT
jgi:hypothetical protein